MLDIYQHSYRLSAREWTQHDSRDSRSTQSPLLAFLNEKKNHL